MFITKMKKKARQQLCYASMLSLVFTMAGTIYAQYGRGANWDWQLGSAVEKGKSTNNPVQIKELD